MIHTNIFLFKHTVFMKTLFCVLVMVCACRGERSESSAPNVNRINVINSLSKMKTKMDS